MTSIHKAFTDLKRELIFDICGYAPLTGANFDDFDFDWGGNETEDGEWEKEWFEAVKLYNQCRVDGDHERLEQYHDYFAGFGMVV